MLDWASRETSRVLQQELGVTASFRVEMQLLPLKLALHDLSVPSSDGGAPFLVAESASVRPRFFSLLAGRLDVGEVEIERPKARVVVQGDKLVNLFVSPSRASRAHAEEHARPVRFAGRDRGEIDLDVDGHRVTTGPMDVDVFTDPGPSFEIGVRAAKTPRKTPRKVTLAAADGAPNRRGELDRAGEREFTFTAWTKTCSASSTRASGSRATSCWCGG